MAMDPEEKYLFAATDAGPYAYSMETEEWHEIAGLSAPLQQYISVEYIPSEQIVRFATWGRGIWDFDIVDPSGIDETENENTFMIYPNPVMNEQITVTVANATQVRLFDLNGRVVLTEQLNVGSNLIDIRNLSAGAYVLVSQSAEGVTSSKKVVVK